jgi:hypothetical protein
MATAHQQISPQPQPQPHLVTVPKLIVPVKAGFMGEQGTGKTTTAGLFAAGLSKKYHGGAPIHVTDPELSWQFLNPVIFHTEKIELVQYTIPTFAAMLRDIDRAEKAGACVWAVELGKIWIEIVRTLQQKDPIGWGMQLRSMWDDFVARFLNSKMHCLVLGRIQDIVEEVILENGSSKSIKVGEGMKAGGQKNNFGYEPHLVIRMNLEQKPRVKRGKTFEDEGRMIHRALVLKDRTWAINGKVFRWADRDDYKAGDFKYVMANLEKHFLAAQKTQQHNLLDTTASSAEIVDADGNGEFYRHHQRKDAISAEIKGCLDLYFGGRGKEEVQIRLAVTDLIFGVKSKEAADTLPLERLERGLQILQVYEKFPEHKLDKREDVLRDIERAIRDFDQGDAEQQDIPF